MHFVRGKKERWKRLHVEYTSTLGSHHVYSHSAVVAGETREWVTTLFIIVQRLCWAVIWLHFPRDSFARFNWQHLIWLKICKSASEAEKLTPPGNTSTKLKLTSDQAVHVQCASARAAFERTENGAIYPLMVSYLLPKSTKQNVQNRQTSKATGIFMIVLRTAIYMPLRIDFDRPQ